MKDQVFKSNAFIYLTYTAVPFDPGLWVLAPGISERDPLVTPRILAEGSTVLKMSNISTDNY